MKKLYHKLPNVPERFNRPIQVEEFIAGYENLYLDFEDFELVKDYIDYWGFLYAGQPKDEEIKHVEDLRHKQFEDEEHKQNYIRKVLRQKAREPFFDELTNLSLWQMSENVRWVAEGLVQCGYATLVL